MADKTGIAWTDETWNPMVGCSVTSPGCTNCYAMHRAGTRLRNHPKFRGLTQPSKAGPVWTGEMRLWQPALELPLKWRKPHMIFANSMSDLFHEAVPNDWINQVFAVMERCPQHIFQVLTKRAERMRDYLAARPAPPLPNLWGGVSVEDRVRAEERIPALLETPAAVRWISAEPLLGPLDLSTWITRLDWVVLGGESERGARPFDVDWARSLIGQCRAADVPVFMKQLGAKPRNAGEGIRDRKGAEPNEWPEDLRVRQYPGPERKAAGPDLSSRPRRP